MNLRPPVRRDAFSLPPGASLPEPCSGRWERTFTLEMPGRPDSNQGMANPLVKQLAAGRGADCALWEQMVEESAAADAYYRPGYALAHEAAGHGRAIALLVQGGGSRVLVPLMLRELTAPPFSSASPGFDAYSPYGYGGLLSLGEPPDRLALISALQDWSRDQGVICTLIRLHPLLDQRSWFTGTGPGVHLVSGNPTTALPVGEWREESQLLAAMSKGRRSDLSMARRNLRVTWTLGGEPDCDSHLQIFRRLYTDSMQRMGADAFYLFPESYFSTLASTLGRRLGVATAWLREEAVGAALFLIGADFCHYHLSATTDLGRRYKATTLLIVTAAAQAAKQGCRQLHLGGGAAADDALFQFKRSFGGTLFQYATVTVVGDTQKFDLLRSGPAPVWPYCLHRGRESQPALGA